MATDINSTYLKGYSLAETKRHKPCLIYRGHRYVQDKIQNRTIYWRCEDRSHCNGRAHQLIGSGSLPILTIKHNHPPIIEDLSKHDIVPVDSHRRRQRQSRNISSLQSHKKGEHKNDLIYPSTSSTMTSPIKFENHQNKYQRFQQQDTSLTKNLHLSEVITTAVPPNIHHYSGNNTHRHPMVDPVEMTKLLNNITKTSTNPPLKTTASPKLDYLSRLNQFSWEELEGRYLPVIYRHENGVNQRYVSKMYVENTLFQSNSWQRHASLARSLPPLVSYSYTEHELKLYRLIIEWHLASVHFKTVPSSDCLICFEDLLDFYNNLRKLRDTLTTTTFNRPIAPLPRPTPIPFKPDIQSQSQSFEVPTQILSSMKQQSKLHLLPQTADIPLPLNRNQEQLSQPTPTLPPQKPPKESGWVQINNVFIPYIVKVKLRENESNKSHTRASAPQLQREFYVPYEILIKCNIFSDNEFALKKLLIKATQEDFDILNNLITNINIFDEKVPEKTFLVNLYHIMVGLNRIFYIKFLPTKQPRTQVNKYHTDVLTQKGGTLIMNKNRLIPYIVQNNRFYVPLLYTFHSIPDILLQAKREARAPRQYEIDYLNLLIIYFSIDIQPLPSDTLLVDIFNIKCPNIPPTVHYRTLHEHQQYEKNKLLNSIVRSQPTPKSTNASSTTHKSNKCPVANVVVNPMIHHPSFYGLTTSKPVLPLQKPLKKAEIKTITHDNHVLNAVIKSSDTPESEWKISLKEIFQKFFFNIDYEKFVQWCQTNLLLPLIKLDDEENQIMKNNNSDTTVDDYYVYQRNLDRCIELLNDLKRDSISMTLLPLSSNIDVAQVQQEQEYEQEAEQLQQPSPAKSPISGAKKRKPTIPTTRHLSPVPTTTENTPLANIIPEEIVCSSSPSSHTEEIVPPENTETGMKFSNDEISYPIVNNEDDDDLMPVVASVEEEQPLEETTEPEIDNTFVIVESTDDSDERIQLDDRILSYASDYESPTVQSTSDMNIHLNDDDETNSTVHSKEQPSSHTSVISKTNPSMISLNNQNKINKKRQQNNNGKSRSRSSTPRDLKKQRLNDDQSILVTIITKEKVEQYLRTLFMSSNEARRTRTRSIRTPTRLVEEIHANTSFSMNTIEPDTNVFEILSSSIANETTNNDESTDNDNQSCTYNVTITDKPNKLGVTIKKVVQS